jgi:hypothetical protein
MSLLFNELIIGDRASNLSVLLTKKSWLPGMMIVFAIDEHSVNNHLTISISSGVIWFFE